MPFEELEKEDQKNECSSSLLYEEEYENEVFNEKNHTTEDEPTYSNRHI